MILEELMEAKEYGTYAAVKFSPETVDALKTFVKENDIPNPIRSSGYHATLLYSRKPCPDYEPAGRLSVPWIGTFFAFRLWDTRDEDKDSKCLVIEFKCPKLTARFEELMDEHDAEFDFPDYKPHVALSYNVGSDFDLKDLPDFKPKLEIVSEYGEDLREGFHDPVDMM